MDTPIWMMRNEDAPSGLDEITRTLTLAYEYILSDQWGKGTPDEEYERFKNKRNIKITFDKG